jgi:hypothetical protein
MTPHAARKDDDGRVLGRPLVVVDREHVTLAELWKVRFPKPLS